MQVESYDGGIGVYDLVVVAVPADTTTAIAVGDIVTGTITTSGEQHRYTFPAAARSILAVDGRGRARDGVAYGIFTPSGTQLGGFPYTCDDLGPQELPETGDYTLDRAELRRAAVAPTRSRCSRDSGRDSGAEPRGEATNHDGRFFGCVAAEANRDAASSLTCRAPRQSRVQPPLRYAEATRRTNSATASSAVENGPWR